MSLPHRWGWVQVRGSVCGLALLSVAVTFPQMSQHTRGTKVVGERASCQNARRFVLCVYLVLHAAGSAGPTVLASRWRGCGRRQSLRAEQQARCRWSSKETTRGIKSWRRNGQQVCGSRQGSGNRRQDGQDIGQIRCKAHKLAHCSEVRHDRRATALEHIPE